METRLTNGILSQTVSLKANSSLSFFSERELKFMFAIGYRPSVCLSVVYLSVTLVHPTQAIEIFGNISTPCGTLAIRDLCITRNSSGDEIANVNFIYDDIVYTHAKIQYTTRLSCTTKRSYSPNR